MLSPIYCGREPPHAYALSVSVDAFEREATENSATLVGDEGSGRFSHELVRGGKNGRHPQRRDPPPFLAHTIVSWAHVSWDNV